MGVDDEHGLLTLAVAHAMRRVDPARRQADEGCRVGLRVDVDLLGHGEQPNETIDAAERGEREVDEAPHALVEVVEFNAGRVARVLTKDGWSTQIDYRIRSTGGPVEFTIGLIENNLLGTASSAAVR